MRRGGGWRHGARRNLHMRGRDLNKLVQRKRRVQGAGGQRRGGRRAARAFAVRTVRGIRHGVFGVGRGPGSRRDERGEGGLGQQVIMNKVRCGWSDEGGRMDGTGTRKGTKARQGGGVDHGVADLDLHADGGGDGVDEAPVGLGGAMLCWLTITSMSSRAPPLS